MTEILTLEPIISTTITIQMRSDTHTIGKNSYQWLWNSPFVSQSLWGLSAQVIIDLEGIVNLIK